MAFEYYRSTIAFSCAGNYAAIVNHWGVDTPTGAGPFARAKSFINALESPVGGLSILELLTELLAEDCFISSARAAKVSPGAGNAFAKVYTDADYPGIFTGNMDAAQVAAMTLWFTGGDASLNGRTFLPGVSEQALDNGRFVSDYKDALSNWRQQMLDGIESSVGTFMPFLKHGSPASYTQIIHAGNSLTPGTQRKRLRPV